MPKQTLTLSERASEIVRKANEIANRISPALGFMEAVEAVAPECEHYRVPDKRGHWFKCQMFIADKYARSVPNRVLAFEHYRSHHPPQYDQRMIID